MLEAVFIPGNVNSSVTAAPGDIVEIDVLLDSTLDDLEKKRLAQR